MYEYGPEVATTRHTCKAVIHVTRAQVEAARLLRQRGNHRPAIQAIAETRLPGER